MGFSRAYFVILILLSGRYDSLNDLNLVSFELKLCLIYVGISLASSQRCDIPKTVRGAWFSREDNIDTITKFDADSMSGRGRCVDSKVEFHTNHTFIFQHQDNCFYCVRIIVRTINILEKIESKYLYIVLRLAIFQIRSKGQDSHLAFANCLLHFGYISIPILNLISSRLYKLPKSDWKSEYGASLC